ncbi:MAG TPA: Gfo/Idh/MocA family oxidoreductase [Solirubrobacteraceae bacterium]|nr:Gfo/Idh/MocA family oxidoreductase [Solirubrobacteraceae bacterium]
MTPRLRVGVVGCGVIAQVMHLPHLSQLEDRYELVAVCDLSPSVAETCRERFGAARAVTRWQELVDMNLDVVLVLTSGSHAPVAIAAAEAGSNVFVEKPMCLSPAEGRSMIDAASRSGVRLMVGTMKRYDPAYQRLVELLPGVEDLRMVRVTTLESPFEPYVHHYPLVAARDVPADLIEALREEDARRLEAALPEADENTRFCYRWMLLDNLVHELNALRGALGEPDRVSFADLSPRVVAIHMTFGGVECHLSWVDLLSGIARYRQEFMFLAPDERLTLTLPSPYLRNMPSQLTVEGGEPGSAHSWARVETVSYDEAFKRELVELHAAISDDRTPLTDGEDGLHDVMLCRAIAQAHLDRGPIENPSREAVGASADDGAVASTRIES